MLIIKKKTLKNHTHTVKDCTKDYFFSLFFFSLFVLLLFLLSSFLFVFPKKKDFFPVRLFFKMFCWFSFQKMIFFFRLDIFNFSFRLNAILLCKICFVFFFFQQQFIHLTKMCCLWILKKSYTFELQRKFHKMVVSSPSNYFSSFVL